jgi:type II secretory pathway pseudopilin PulG
MRQVTRVCAPCRAGFTLVEAIVIVGIISLLIALVVTGLGRAREMGRRAVCLNHVRQVSAALIAYAAENDQFFPFKARSTAVAGSGPWDVEMDPADWIYWQPGPPPAPPPRDWQKSAIAPFLGSETGFNQAVLQCPSDNLDQRPRSFPTDGPYGYSYTINGRMASNPDAPTNTATYPTGPIRVRDIVTASDKILLVDEDARSIDDGNFDPTQAGKPLESMLATRHDSDRQTDSSRGVVGLADVHADMVERAYVKDVRHFEPTAKFPGP